MKRKINGVVSGLYIYCSIKTPTLEELEERRLLEAIEIEERLIELIEDELDRG